MIMSCAAKTRRPKEGKFLKEIIWHKQKLLQCKSGIENAAKIRLWLRHCNFIANIVKQTPQKYKIHRIFKSDYKGITGKEGGKKDKIKAQKRRVRDVQDEVIL